ncbi:unnamed protein product [Tuber aestivum]|uniref:Uncharacterized protein n=1 Tax=Tuber aestivum TaxID=59557 RepID=A0A292Q700_9PEZI|nr:unnamed protein product [Tuber aestivum]
MMMQAISIPMLPIIGDYRSRVSMAGAQPVHPNIYATLPASEFATEGQRSTVLGRMKGPPWGVSIPSARDIIIANQSLRSCSPASGQTAALISYPQISHHSRSSRRPLQQNGSPGTHDSPLSGIRESGEGLSPSFILFDKSVPGLNLRETKNTGGKSIDAIEVCFDSYKQHGTVPYRYLHPN